MLTPSGLMLASDRVLQGAGRVTVRVVLSGRSFPAWLAGTDPAHGLGLLHRGRPGVPAHRGGELPVPQH